MFSFVEKQHTRISVWISYMFIYIYINMLTFIQRFTLHSLLYTTSTFQKQQKNKGKTLKRVVPTGNKNKTVEENKNTRGRLAA